MVTLYAIIVTLPEKDELIILQNSKTAERCVWTEKSREEYLRLLDRAVKTYELGEAVTSKLLPYYAKIIHPTGRVGTMYRITGHEVKILGPAGTREEPGGLNLVLIRKHPGEPHWRDSFIRECSGKGYGDFNSFETRSNREFIRAVSERENPPCDNLKLVAVPSEFEVRLTKNRHGEYVQEVGRVWS